MKLVRRIISMICIMALAVSLCGCGNAAKKLYGTWEMSVDISKVMEESIGDEMGDFHQEFIAYYVFNFNEDGTYTFDVEKDKTTANIVVWTDALIDYVVQFTLDQMAASGMDAAQTEAIFQKTYGCSIKEYMKKTVASALDFNTLFDAAHQEGYYKVKKDKLYLSKSEEEFNSYALYSLDDGALTLSAPEEEVANTMELLKGFPYPFVFSKVVEE